MNLDTGDTKPKFSALYHASAAGCEIIDKPLAELIADDVVAKSDSP
jgi:hypothetical protein